METKWTILPVFAVWEIIRFSLLIYVFLFMTGIQSPEVLLIMLSTGAPSLLLPCMGILSMVFPQKYSFTPPLMALGKLAGIFPLAVYFISRIISYFSPDYVEDPMIAGLVLPFIILSVDLIFIPVLLSLKKEHLENQ
ncbi:MAG: hypothetical protein EHM28_11550 [Spirochaetaceae bacterium]|nr:MAG: hypothetical protein EHM28_11550 [Spirochaetaceae bacterium]